MARLTYTQRLALENLDLGAFIRGYKEGLLFTGHWHESEDEDENPIPLEEYYHDIGCFDEGSMKSELAKELPSAIEFARRFAGLIRGREWQAGMDFHLTRNGHGAGFWDGDWPYQAGRILSDASEVYGSAELYGYGPDCHVCMIG